jgi:hypothetical protein
VTAALAFSSGPFRAHGHVFAVASEDASFTAYVDDAFADLRTDRPAAATYEVHRMPDGQLRVLFGSGSVGTGGLLSDVMACLMWHVNQEATWTASRDQVVLHASCAALDGTGVILAGPMESGKTTTVAALLGAGYGYLTDEAVAIEPETLLLRAYPKPLSIDPGSQSLLAHLAPVHEERGLGQWLVAGSAVGPSGCIDAVPAGVAIMLRYTPGASTALEPLSRAQLLVELAGCTFHFSDEPRRNLDVTAAMLQGCDTYRLVTGNLDEAVELVTDAVHRRNLTVEASR